MNITPKKAKIEHRKSKNEVIFEDEVKEILDKEHHISKPQLKAYLLKVHKGELGYSEKTIDRKLSQMKSEDLPRLEYDDYKKFGITEKNKRVVIYISKKYLKMKEDLDNIFEYIESEDPVAQKLAFEEIRRHDGVYLFNSDQLNVLASRLDSADGEFVNSLLDTLCEYVLGRGIEPSDKDKLIVILKELLKKCKIDSSDYPNFRRHILWLLSYYGDSSVIEQLKKDAEELEDPTIIVAEYCNEYVAPLIEEYLFEFFGLQVKLRQEGKERALEFVSRIKDYACDPQNKLRALERNTSLYEKIQKLREERIQKFMGRV
jgi:hypothetical protein